MPGMNRVQSWMLVPPAYKATEDFRPQFSPSARAKMGLNVLLERQKGPVLLHSSTESPAEINSMTSMASVTHLSPCKIKGSSANLSQGELCSLEPSQCTGSQDISGDFPAIQAPTPSAGATSGGEGMKSGCCCSVGWDREMRAEKATQLCKFFFLCGWGKYMRSKLM